MPADMPIPRTKSGTDFEADARARPCHCYTIPLRHCTVPSSHRTVAGFVAIRLGSSPGPGYSVQQVLLRTESASTTRRRDMAGPRHGFANGSSDLDRAAYYELCFEYRSRDILYGLLCEFFEKGIDVSQAILTK
jgi:hypothetical protein